MNTQLEDTWLSRFQKELFELSLRPAMFTGNVQLELVSAYLGGYTAAIATECPEIASYWNFFQQWIEAQNGIRHPDWHWTRILRKKYGADLDAIASIPVEFQKLIEHGVPDDPHRWADVRVIELRGDSTYFPKPDEN